MHCFKPTDQFARANKRIEIFRFKKIKCNCLSERGAFQFQTADRNDSALKIKVGSGKYIGDLHQVTAFVWDEPKQNEQGLINQILRGAEQ
jgi:hypothetical protein